jgi:pyridoxal phosphate enzyme (YggS family)
MTTGEFQERLDRVRAAIRQACERAGRDPAGVTLVAVSKTVSPDDVAAASGCGQTVFGESRVQEARQKIPLCPSGLEWHMVGHLQRNKARDAAALFSAVHSADSADLLRRLDAAAAEAGVTLRVCLEVNVSGEGSKYGLAPAAVPGVLAECGGLTNVDIVGLMTVPPFSPDPEAARPHFRALRALRDRCRTETGLALEHLSMGMSGDFEVAVEEGATLVRVGRVLFGPRQNP